MLKLDLKKEPFWLDLPAHVRVKVKPLTSALMHMAQAEAIRSMLALQTERKTRLEAGQDVAEIPDLTDDQTRQSVSHTTLMKELAKASIIVWEQVFLPGTDNVAPLTKDNIGELMDIWFMNEAFGISYLKQLDVLEAEGNASRPVANGTMAAGRVTAKGVRRKTSPARAEKPTS
jgi:hypothetical protein